MENRVAVITGGCGQVGSSVAKRLASLGMTVIIITHRDEKRAQNLINSLYGQGHFYLMASVIDTLALKHSARQIQDRVGRCDVLVNAAGILTPISPAKLHDLTDELFDEMIITNLRGTYAVIREFSDMMKSSGNGLIVNISSQSGQRASNSCVAYAASKAGMDLMTRTLAKSMAPTVRVVGIAPGYLENATSGVARLESNEALAKGSPMGRLASPEDISDVVESLCTKMKFVTGNTILLDGGRLL
jgi:NAD(P)-dependent dehydrogenase (short-subunit alcohol dehydrogenase family)